LVTAEEEGATRKRLATTIPGQSFLCGRVPGYKPQNHEVSERADQIGIENGVAELMWYPVSESSVAVKLESYLGVE
jgi:hypothetical protein